MASLATPNASEMEKSVSEENQQVNQTLTREHTVSPNASQPHLSDERKPQAAGKHYSLMPTEEIISLPVKSFCAKNAVLFLWATGPKLPEALKVMAGWGFHFFQGGVHVSLQR